MAHPFAPLDPAFRADPYPAYAELRELGACHVEELDVWVVSCYEDVLAVLRSPVASNADPYEAFADIGGRAMEMLARWMLVRQGEDHLRLRRPANRVFTPRVVGERAGEVTAIVDELLDAVHGQPEFDVAVTLASPLPAYVTSRLLGIADDQRDDVATWTEQLAPSLEPLRTPEDVASVQRAAGGFLDFMRDEVARHRTRESQGDVTDLLLAASADERLGEDELLANLVLLFAAGHHTTAGLIANALLALARFPEQARWLREHPEAMEGAVEEFLRFDAPVQLTRRRLVEDLQLGDVLVPAGANMVVSLAAANRDERVFDAPGELRLDRDEARPLSFGMGNHFCLGAPLARREAAIALRELLRRTSDLEVTGFELSPTLTLRTPSSVRVRAVWN